MGPDGTITRSESTALNGIHAMAFKRALCALVRDEPNDREPVAPTPRTVTSRTQLPELAADDVRELLAQCDDVDSHHVLFVTHDGRVHITNASRKPSAWEGDRSIRFRYETYVSGNGYVGPRAAADDGWVRELVADLRRDWSEEKTGYVDY